MEFLLNRISSKSLLFSSILSHVISNSLLPLYRSFVVVWQAIAWVVLKNVLTVVARNMMTRDTPFSLPQLFEKLTLQESPEGGEHLKKHSGKGTPSIPCPETTLPTPGSRDRDTKGGDRRRDPRLSGETVRARENDEHRAPVKAQGPETARGPQQKVSQPYGRVHTRHIKQLFIRGEHVILVNPQPLWMNSSLLICITGLCVFHFILFFVYLDPTPLISIGDALFPCYIQSLDHNILGNNEVPNCMS